MTKKILHDMIPPEKRTIRRVSLGSTRRSRRSPAESAPENDNERVEADDTPKEAGGSGDVPGVHLGGGNRGGRGGRKRFVKGMWAGGALVLALLLFVSFSIVFAGARIEISPKQEQVVLDGDFTAVRDSEAGGLSFSVLVVERDESKIVTATGEEQVDKKSSGRIVVYNNYDSKNQRLIKNTRFETPEGLIYRINKSIVVPGREKNTEGEFVPGSIEVEVFADTSGDEYNIEKTDFTIPGFKGDPRFSKFYARSKTAMVGGFSGVVKTVDPEELAFVRAGIQESLSAQILKEAHSSKPEGFVLFDDAVFTKFESLPNENVGSDDKVAVREKATLYGVMFNEVDLSKFIALNTIADYDGEEVVVKDIESLSFSVSGKEGIDPEDISEVNFTFRGPAKIVWLFDEGRLREDLAGKLKRNTETVLSAYPAIEQAAIVVRPFWKREFPENASKIKVETTLDE